MTTFLIIWFAGAVLAALWTAFDLLTNQPAIMPVMKIAWVLIVLYLGVIGLILYIYSCRAPSSVDHGTAEFVSLTVMVMGMFPTMYALMKAVGGSAGHMPSPASLEFWGIMTASIAVGFVISYPANWWMVSIDWKRGMGSARVMGSGGGRKRQQMRGLLTG